MEMTQDLQMATNAELMEIIDAAQERFKVAQENMKIQYADMMSASEIYMEATKVLNERRGLTNG